MTKHLVKLLVLLQPNQLFKSDKKSKKIQYLLVFIFQHKQSINISDKDRLNLDVKKLWTQYVLSGTHLKNVLVSALRWTNV